MPKKSIEETAKTGMDLRSLPLISMMLAASGLSYLIVESRGEPAIISVCMMLAFIFAMPTAERCQVIRNYVIRMAIELETVKRKLEEIDKAGEDAP